MALFAKCVNGGKSVDCGIHVTVDGRTRNVFQSGQIAQSESKNPAVHSEDGSQYNQSDEEPRNNHHDENYGNGDNQNVLQ